LSDIYLQKTGIAFQEESGKAEGEKDTQRIALEVKNAIDYLKDAADSNPNNIIFQHKMGSTYFAAARDLGVAGAGDWAIKKFNRAIELEPTNPVLYTELGKTFNLADQTDLAIDQFQKALKYKADYLDAGLQLGLSYEKKEEKEKAIDALNSMGTVQRMENAIAAGQVVTSANLDIDIAFQLGRIYYNTGEVSRARDIFAKVVKINPNHSNAHYSLGLIYSSEGDKEKALKEFEAVLLLNPENEDVKKKIDELKGVSSNKKSEEVKEITPALVEKKPVENVENNESAEENKPVYSEKTPESSEENLETEEETQ
ncbi:tetratricopeptide repeat protein, partial [Patescibacteria group bacterium]|nr:tetratricopeptide repeat protein [Patescibacteria group bacterium]